MSTVPQVLWFADIDQESEWIGAHSKQLAGLTKAKLPILPGFIITQKAYTNFLRENNLDKKIEQLFSTIAFDRSDSLMQGEYHVRQLFKNARLPEELVNEILDFYDELDAEEISISLFETGNHGRKHKTIHATTEEELNKQIILLWSEMFTSNALWHRHQRGHNHLQANAEIIIQREIHTDLEGTIFTIDPSTHKKNKIVIMTHHPHKGDTYILSKKTLTILDRILNYKPDLYKLTLDEILELGEIAKKVDEHLYLPHEIMWAVDEGKVYITEIKPFTQLLQPKTEKKSKLPIARGKGVTAKIGTGIVNIIHSPLDLQTANTHNVLVVANLEANQLPYIKKTQGIIVEANQWHSEIIAILKQYGIPAIVNVKQATKFFKNGRVITIHGGKGEIYSGGFH